MGISGRFIPTAQFLWMRKKKEKPAGEPRENPHGDVRKSGQKPKCFYSEIKTEKKKKGRLWTTLRPWGKKKDEWHIKKKGSKTLYRLSKIPGQSNYGKKKLRAR